MNWHIFRPSTDSKREVLESRIVSDPRVENFQPNRLVEVVTRTSVSYPFSDPLYPQQWHLHNEAQLSSSTAGADVNVKGAWAMGYSGKNVLIQFVDDGLEHTHTDVASKYVTAAR